MSDTPYLVALAFVELNGQRALPLTGKSWADGSSDAEGAAADPGDAGRGLALELLLRLWQRSDDGALRRAAGDDSLLLLAMPLEVMSERLPVLKANWLGGADTATVQASIRELALQSWRVSIAKYEPVRFTPC